MPKVSVYLSQELYDRAKAHSLPISSLAQEAIVRALAHQNNDEWIKRMRSRPARVVGDVDTTALMAEVRDEWGT